VGRDAPGSCEWEPGKARKIVARVKHPRRQVIFSVDIMVYKPSQLLRISSRLCLDCGASIEPERTTLTCAACVQKKALEDQARRRARLDLGQCHDFAQPIAAGKARCPSCLAQRQALHRAYRAQWLADVRCMQCGTADPLPALADKREPLCETCWYRRTARNNLGTSVHWRLLRDKFAAQDGRCPYSGDALTLGLNAALDHILPTSRFPGRRFDPSNVEWDETGRHA
jgi:hypothetical protein